MKNQTSQYGGYLIFTVLDNPAEYDTAPSRSEPLPPIPAETQEGDCFSFSSYGILQFVFSNFSLRYTIEGSLLSIFFVFS